MIKAIRNWFGGVSRTFAREFSLVFHNTGVMIFFFFLPVVYPIVYTLIYNPEVVRDLPVVVVDECRTSQSRTLTRQADATEAIRVIGYAADMNEARKAMNEKECYGILQIPADYAKRIGRGEQGVVAFYGEMSLLMRYRSFVAALSDLQLETGAEIRQETLQALGASGSASMGMPVKSQSYFIGDPTQGFASFVIPGIVVLILQQSMILGVTMLGGAASERRRKNGGIDPLAIKTSTTASMIGKMLCYLVIYMPLTIYILHIVPLMFDLPHLGNPLDYLPFILPMMIASIFLGMTAQIFVKERETSMIVVVFTSVIFLFISGLTWPRYAMSDAIRLLSDCIPATWGVQGSLQINSNGATLADTSTPYTMLWLLSAIYFLSAYLTHRFRQNHN